MKLILINIRKVKFFLQFIYTNLPKRQFDFFGNANICRCLSTYILMAKEKRKRNANHDAVMYLSVNPIFFLNVRPIILILKSINDDGSGRTMHSINEPSGLTSSYIANTHRQRNYV